MDVSGEVLDVSGEVLDVSTSVLEVLDVSAAVLEPLCVDLSGTDQVIAKIDVVLRELPVIPEDPREPVDSATSKLWLPSRPAGAALGPPMSRATSRG